ncbi:polysaccharide deacetylase family protein [Actinomycetospora endophytica]|uniref:Polysaccharide deacetylase family protein n=1 Tax=Actinomycetospora endophytica TaxID=2291215 RepID=A0ABS8PCK1_9PSEU|nr:polysaccharide deacetylase family protein [Actinomycetospora endophytica]MCD2195146.1 polysaccharide deacetylase family protein [Actinomycetospora endophytica]
MNCPGPHLPRRRLLGLLGLGAVAALTGFAGGSGANAAVPTAEAGGPAAPPPPPAPIPVPPEAPLAGGPVVLREGPTTTNRIALTIDDGYCADCVAGYTDFVARTGINLTFSPNGIYGPAWAPSAPTLAPLVERGQLQIINHTYTHQGLEGAGSSTVREELERNEAWIEATFRTTARPWWRPPYGRYDESLEQHAAELGYDRLVMWNGSYADSQLITPEFLLAQASMAFKPGGIVLGHANHPTVLGLFGPLVEMLQQRGLRPVTLRALLDGHGRLREPGPGG